MTAAASGEMRGSTAAAGAASVPSLAEAPTAGGAVTPATGGAQTHPLPSPLRP
jgi:hypothetical protein